MEKIKATALRVAAWTLGKIGWGLSAFGAYAESAGKCLGDVALRLDPDVFD